MKFISKIALQYCCIIILHLHSMESMQITINGHKHSLQRIWDVENLRDLLNATNERSLVIWDVDGTLIASSDLYDRGFIEDRIQAYTIEALTLSRNVEDKAKRIMLASRARQLKKFMLVHDKLPAIIQDLHKRNVPTIALTNCNTGQFGCITSMEDWRLKALKILGIEFNGSFANLPDITFEQLRKQRKVPTFKRGILFTGQACSKGQLLSAFLRRVGFAFEEAVCIDDQVNMLASECSALTSMNIPCVPVHYMGGHLLPCKFDFRIAAFQLKYLIDHDIWLTGEQAQKILEEDKLSCCLVQ